MKTLLLLLTVMAATSAVVGSAAGLPLEIAMTQPDCPIVVNSATSSTEFLFDSVTMTNRTDRAIQSIVMAISFSDDVFSDRAVSVRLAQQSVRLAGRGKVNVEKVGIAVGDATRTVSSAKLSKPRVTIGIVEVTFADGGVWRYDLDRQQHRFPGGTPRVASVAPKDGNTGSTNQDPACN